MRWPKNYLRPSAGWYLRVITVLSFGVEESTGGYKYARDHNQLINSARFMNSSSCLATSRANTPSPPHLVFCPIRRLVQPSLQHVRGVEPLQAVLHGKYGYQCVACKLARRSGRQYRCNGPDFSSTLQLPARCFRGQKWKVTLVLPSCKSDDRRCGIISPQVVRVRWA